MLSLCLSDNLVSHYNSPVNPQFNGSTLGEYAGHEDGEKRKPPLPEERRFSQSINADQNTNFRANCNWREVAAFVMTPAEGLNPEPEKTTGLGLAKFARFNKLKAS